MMAKLRWPMILCYNKQHAQKAENINKRPKNRYCKRVGIKKNRALEKNISNVY